MENLALIYEDIKTLGYMILLILALCTTGVTLIIIVGRLFNTKKFNKKDIYTLFISSTIFFFMNAFLSYTGISDIQYKQISSVFLLNDSNVKTKIFDISRDNIITKKEYISLFFKPEGIFVEDNSTHYKNETLKMITNYQM